MPRSASATPTGRRWTGTSSSPTPSRPTASRSAATDPLYVLYTSGTTGRPKGIVRDNGGHAVALRWSMDNVYGIGPGDVWFTASDVGWVVGHSYIVYAPLLTGATTVLYEGKPVGTPDAGRLLAGRRRARGARPCSPRPRHTGRSSGTTREASCSREHDISSLETVFLAGERLDPDTYEWATSTLGVPVVDNWWQTETGWPIAANPRGLEPMPIKAGSPSVPMPGYAVVILDETGAPLPAGEEGAIASGCRCRPGPCHAVGRRPALRRRLPLDLPRLLRSRATAGCVDEDGYLYVMGRTDDVLNVAGHRLSTGSIEAALAGHPDVAECAVIGVADELKGQLPRGLVVLKGGVDAAGAEGERIRAELVKRVRDEVGAVAALRQVDIVAGAAQDPLRQDPAQDDARDRRRPHAHRPRRPSRTRPCSTRSDPSSAPAADLGSGASAPGVAVGAARPLQGRDVARPLVRAVVDAHRHRQPPPELLERVEALARASTPRARRGAPAACPTPCRSSAEAVMTTSAPASR